MWRVTFKCYYFISHIRCATRAGWTTSCATSSGACASTAPTVAATRHASFQLRVHMPHLPFARRIEQQGRLFGSRLILPLILQRLCGFLCHPYSFRPTYLPASRSPYTHNSQPCTRLIFLQCDELLCGPDFVTCAGANRRRLGITTDIARGGAELCNVNRTSF